MNFYGRSFVRSYHKSITQKNKVLFPKCSIATVFNTHINRQKPTLGSNVILPKLPFREQFIVRTFCNKNEDQEKKSKDQFENVLTIPNVLTVSRIVMCPILGYLVIHNEYCTAFSLFLVAGLTDLV